MVIHLADDIGLLAYGFREIQGKRNFAVCVVRGGLNNLAVFTQLEREIVLFQCACADLDIQFLGGVQSYRNVACGIGVGKLDTIRGGTIFRNGAICHLQLAVAVVRDGNRHTVAGAVIRNTCDFTFGGDILGDVVHIRAGFIEGNTSEVKVGSRSVVASLTRHYALGIAFVTSLGGQRGTIDSHQFETETIVLVPIAARQNLYALERVIFVGRFHGNRGRVIGVCHRDFLGCTCFDLARVVRIARGVACARILFRDGIGAACGQAHNLGSLAIFQGECTAILDGNSGLFNVCLIGNGVVVRGIGGQGLALFGRQRKLHLKFGFRVRVQTLVGCNHLFNLQAACGVHGQLTVVAKVQHTLVCVKVPLEVNAALRGVGWVIVITLFVFLIAQLVINGGGQAAFFGVRLDVVVTIRILSYALLDGTFLINVHGNHIFLNKRFITFVRVLMQVVQLIVIDFALFKTSGRRILSVFAFPRFGVQQRILGVIVEAVAFCGGKGGRGQADGCFAVCRCFGVIKFVGVEADCALVGVFRNVGGKGGVGKAAGRNLVAHTLFKADRVDDADGLGVVDFQRRLAIGVCDLIIPQGQHTGRDLDLHMIAVTAAATGDGDNDVFQFGCLGVGTADRAAMRATKGIGIPRVGAGFVHLRKDLVGKGNGLKALDFHIIAQGIIESHVAFFLGLVRNLRGAWQCDRYGIEDVLKDILQLISAGSRHIVICIVRSVAEVPDPGNDPPQWIIRIPGVSGKGVVAGDRLHELVFF